MYALTDYEQRWIYSIHRILIFLGRAAFSSRIQISFYLRCMIVACN
jgi:hypothetical protein